MTDTSVPMSVDGKTTPIFMSGVPPARTMRLRIGQAGVVPGFFVATIPAFHEAGSRHGTKCENVRLGRSRSPCRKPHTNQEEMP
jgi:hypothetical protein